MKRILIGLAVLSLLGTMTVACAGGGAAAAVSITPTQTDPNKVLHHDWSPGGPPMPGTDGIHAASCMYKSDGSFCRVIYGYEEVGDRANWRITGTPSKSYGSSTSGYGLTIEFTGLKLIYEGCVWISPDNSYICDYQEGGSGIVNTGGSAIDYYLNVTYHWAVHTAEAVGCIEGIAAVVGGVTAFVKPLLLGCLGGPYNPNFVAQVQQQKLMEVKDAALR